MTISPNTFESINETVELLAQMSGGSIIDGLFEYVTSPNSFNMDELRTSMPTRLEYKKDLFIEGNSHIKWWKKHISEGIGDAVELQDRINNKKKELLEEFENRFGKRSYAIEDYSFHTLSNIFFEKVRMDEGYEGIIPPTITEDMDESKVEAIKFMSLLNDDVMKRHADYYGVK